MSHKKNQFWVMMPVLGVLLMSPQDVQTKFGRHIASVSALAAETTVEERATSKTPILDELLKGLTIPDRQNPLNLNSSHLKEEITSSLSQVSKAEEYDRDTVKSSELDKHLEEVKSAAVVVAQVENSIKDLLNPNEEGDLRSSIGEAKIILEASLKDLAETRILVAKRDAPVAAVTRAPGVVQEETIAVSSDKEEVKEEVKKEEEKKEEKDPLLCALEEQNKLLQQQLQGFVQQQSLIMQQLMQLTQMMTMQNMYRVPDTFNYRNAYQYHQPQVAGNWVYYPNGLQPIQPGQQLPGQVDQSNIFGLSPQMPAQPQMQQPGMMNQGGQWGLAPQLGSAQTPGSFGMEATGFNMSAQSTTPGPFI